MSSKKDLAASAGDFASSLFDRLKKTAAERNKNSTPTPTPPAASILTNIAQNFIANTANGSSSGISFSKLLDENSNNKPKTLTFYDDDNLDDDDFDVNKMPTSSVKSSMASVPSSKSEVNIKSSANKSTSSESESKMSTSSSFHRLSSVLDDILKSDLANSVVDTAASEAVQLRKRILTKKKSIENSLENIKSKSRTSSKILTDSEVSTPVFEETKPLDEARPDEIETKSVVDNLSQPISDLNNTPPLVEPVANDSPEPVDTKPEFLLDEPMIKMDDSLPKPPEKISKPIDRTIIYVSILVTVFIALLLARSLSTTILTFILGVLLGCGLTFGLFYLAVKYDLVKYFHKTPTNNETNPTGQLQSLLIQTPIVKENKNFQGVYKGWMNELREAYEPEKHFLNKTRSVYSTSRGLNT